MDNKYKDITDEYYKLYESFVNSGFSKEQAFELIKAYCTQSVFDSMLRNINEEKRRASRQEILKKMSSMNAEETTT